LASYRFLSTAPAHHGPDIVISKDILPNHYHFTHEHNTVKETLEEEAHPHKNNNNGTAQRSTLATDSIVPHTTEHVSSYDHVDTQRISVLMQLTDRVGILHDVLR
jgi:ACT domain-containing protein